MKALLWRLVYAVICFWLAITILPMLLMFLGLSLGGGWPLIRICLAGIAVLYVLFGPEPRMPF